VKVTRSWPEATFTAATAVGAAGEPTITSALAAEAALVPMALVAVTRQVNRFEVAAPEIVIGEVVPVAFTAATPLWVEVQVAT
jgi:hypothetical protein